MTDLLAELQAYDLSQLTAVNLALQDPGTETRDLNVERADFFYVRPNQSSGGTVYPDEAEDLRIPDPRPPRTAAAIADAFRDAAAVLSRARRERTEVGEATPTP